MIMSIASNLRIHLMKKYIFLLCSLIALPAFSQTSFLGISIDMPFPGKMAECPKVPGIDMVDHRQLKEAGMCYFLESPTKFTIWNSPDLGIGHSLELDTYDDKPVRFNMRFNKTAYLQAVETFTKRYGKPQKSFVEPVSIKSGRQFASHTNVWEGPVFIIKLSEVGADVRWSDGTVINVPVFKALQKKGLESAQGAAGKL